MQSEAYLVSEDDSEVTVCAALLAGSSERNVLVVLHTEGGDADGN